MMLRFISFILLTSTTTVTAFGVVSTHTPHPIAATTTVSSTTRADFLQSMWTSSAAAAAAAAAVVVMGNPSRSNAAASETVTLPNGVVYTILKQGTGPKPERGELVAIRFAAYNGDIQIDNIFDTPEPYYTRLGSGGLIPGVESTLPLMQLGDRWKITIPGDLAFGKKGRPSSAGKPRIPADATIVFEVEMVGLPGKEPELIDIIGDV